MYISKHWLGEFVSIPSAVTDAELALQLTMAMAEVEGVEDQRTRFAHVVVGEILSVRKHPNADKLQLAEVSIGKKQLHIVCGAPNIAPGQKVPVALVGATLPNGMTIVERAVRGENSQGMLCAADELGLGEDHSGIIILPGAMKVGIPFAQALGMDDVIIEIDNKSLTHRPDLWGHYGVAREVAAIYKKKLAPLDSFIAQPKTAKGKLAVSVEDQKLCPRYTAVRVDGVSAAASPDWLKKRIEAVGGTSINAIVDVTNYVMYELGQPMHAFDAQSLQGGQLRVRTAERGERIVGLDGLTYVLDSSVLVIADKNRPVAIAGIMGGDDTKITEATSSILLESATFDHVAVRKASQQLNIRTESSMRFEKSLDPNQTMWALYRAVALLQRCFPEARVTSAIADVKKFKLNQGPLKISVAELWKKIGEEIPVRTITDILQRLGFGTRVAKNLLTITIPTWRATKDISITDDIVEEVARIYGYDNLKPTLPRGSMTRPQENLQRTLERRMKQLLAYGCELAEAYNYSFVSEQQAVRYGESADSFVRIANPIDMSYPLMRRSLVPNLVAAAGRNLRFFDRVGMFEFGSTYRSDEPGAFARDSKGDRLPNQDVHASVVLTEKGNASPFFTVKNIVEQVLHQLRIPYAIDSGGTGEPWMHGSRKAQIVVGGEVIGYIAELSAGVQRAEKIDYPVALCDINIARMAAHYTNEAEYQPIPKYPDITLDISAVVPAQTLWGEVSAAVYAASRELIRSVELFDVYAGTNIEAGKKSIAFHVVYRSSDKTLEMKEAEAVHARVKESLISRFGAQIR